MTEFDEITFRAAPLWSWNGLMEPEACAAEMACLASAGFGGAYAHVRLGMLIPFLGTQYIDCLKASVTSAKQLGLRLNLYDEDRWPSGWAGGAVPLASEEYRLKALVRRPEDEPLPSDCQPLLKHDVWRYDVWTMPLGHPKFSGTCYVDLTNPDAVECFLRNAFDPLADALEQHFDDVIETIFSDEPALTYLYSWPDGGVPWSNAIPARLQRRTSEPLADILASIFDDGAASPRRRLLYYRELASLFDESFMQQVAGWRRRGRVAWTGHFMYEHSLPLHFSWSVNCHGSYRRFDWPGVDHLGRQVGEVVTALGCRSAVHQFNKPRMMTELFGASGQNLSFADRKWIAEQQVVLGANHLVPHVSSESIAGARKRDYPPTISPHQPWWPLNRHFEDHCARLCAVMARGRGAPELLVIHPQETVMARSRGPVMLGSQPTWETRFFCPSSDETLNELDWQWKQLCHFLLDAGYVFDFGDEGVLAECGSVDAINAGEPPRFRVGDAVYAGVLIPELDTLRQSTIDLLSRFVNCGGTVGCVGAGPTKIDGEGVDSTATPLTQLLKSLPIFGLGMRAAVAALICRVPPHIQPLGNATPHGRVWRHARIDGDQRITLLTNVDRFGSRELDLCFAHATPTDAVVWQTHAAHAEPLAVKDGTARLMLEPGGSAVIFEHGTIGLPVPHAPRSARPPVDVLVDSLEWRVSRVDPNSLIVDDARWRRPGESWQGPHPVLAVKDYLDRQRYEGPLELSYNLPSTAALEPDALLEIIFEADDCHEAFVNGRRVDTHRADALPLGGRGFHKFAMRADNAAIEIDVVINHSKFCFGDPAQLEELDRRLGTPLESLVLSGDFAVLGRESQGAQEWAGQIEYHTGEPLNHWLPPQQLRYLEPPWMLAEPTALTLGDVTRQGLPFYAGRIRYEAELKLQERPTSGLHIVADRLPAAAAEVEVNGRPVGVLAWAPLAVDVSEGVQTGDNHIAITLHHTLRNLLGPHHHASGEPVYANPESFRPVGVPQWLETLQVGQSPPGWRKSYCIVEFGLSAPRVFRS